MDHLDPDQRTLINAEMLRRTPRDLPKIWYRHAARVRDIAAQDTRFGELDISLEAVRAHKRRAEEIQRNVLVETCRPGVARVLGEALFDRGIAYLGDVSYWVQGKEYGTLPYSSGHEHLSIHPLERIGEHTLDFLLVYRERTYPSVAEGERQSTEQELTGRITIVCADHRRPRSTETERGMERAMDSFGCPLHRYEAGELRRDPHACAEDALRRVIREARGRGGNRRAA